MPNANRSPFSARPLPSFSLPPFGNPLDALPAAINHLLAAEPWARAQLAPHLGKTLHVVVAPFTIRLSVAGDGVAAGADAGSVTVVRALPAASPATTITLPYAALPRFVGGGPDAAMRDLRIDGDADFAQSVALLVRNLRWDVEEDLSKVIGDVASHRVVGAARAASKEIRRTNERIVAGISEYLLEENPHLVRPRAVATLADGVRRLRDDLARLEKRCDRLSTPAPR